MRIVEDMDEVEVITMRQARNKVEQSINNVTDNRLYVVKYDGKLISLSGRYYKFGYKKMQHLRTALTNKFGKDLARALVESDVITVEEWNMS